MKYFLGVKVVHLDDGSIWIGQPSCTKAVLNKFNMEVLKSVATPVETGTKLIKQQMEIIYLTKKHVSLQLDVSSTPFSY